MPHVGGDGDGRAEGTFPRLQRPYAIDAPARRRPPPQAWAARFIEKHERSARAWYGGAVGHVAFDGSLNTGLTLRTIHYADGVASVRAGATLLYDSDPIAEEAETELKAPSIADALSSVSASSATGSES